jgi:uncharacterized DUF497 family protein
VIDLDWRTAIIREETRREYRDPRLLVMARLDGRLHVVVVTPRGADLRVISFRTANRREVRLYGKKETDNRASRPDNDNPEWTPEDFAEARPAGRCCLDLSARKRRRR